MIETAQRMMANAKALAFLVALHRLEQAAGRSL